MRGVCSPAAVERGCVVGLLHWHQNIHPKIIVISIVAYEWALIIVRAKIVV